MKVLVTACVLVALLLAAPAQATWSGEAGAIAFVRKPMGAQFGTTDIWIETPTGRQRRLTATPEVTETQPAFSPDGRAIAYVRRAGEGDSDIWLMKSDGSGKRPLVERASVDEQQPSFFPGGRSLVFTAFRDQWQVFSIRRNGTGRKLRARNATDPAISPDGRHLAYSQVQPTGGIRLLDLRTRRLRKLTSRTAQELDFSPDGRELVFSANRRCRPGGSVHAAILTVDLRNGTERFLRRDCAHGYGDPVWSPGGMRILCAAREVVHRKVRSRLELMTAKGRPAKGAPLHRAGTLEFAPDWQPLPGGTR